MQGGTFRYWWYFIAFIYGNIQSSTYKIKGSYSQFNTTLKMTMVVTLRVCWWVEDCVQLSRQREILYIKNRYNISITVLLLGSAATPQEPSRWAMEPLENALYPADPGPAYSTNHIPRPTPSSFAPSTGATPRVSSLVASAWDLEGPPGCQDPAMCPQPPPSALWAGTHPSHKNLPHHMHLTVHENKDSFITLTCMSGSYSSLWFLLS